MAITWPGPAPTAQTSGLGDLHPLVREASNATKAFWDTLLPSTGEPRRAPIGRQPGSGDFLGLSLPGPAMRDEELMDWPGDPATDSARGSPDVWAGFAAVPVDLEGFDTDPVLPLWSSDDLWLPGTPFSLPDLPSDFPMLEDHLTDAEACPPWPFQLPSASLDVTWRGPSHRLGLTSQSIGRSTIDGDSHTDGDSHNGGGLDALQNIRRSIIFGRLEPALTAALQLAGILLAERSRADHVRSLTASTRTDLQALLLALGLPHLIDADWAQIAAGTWRRPFGAGPTDLGTVELDKATDMLRSLLGKRQQLIRSLTARRWRPPHEVADAVSAAQTPAALSFVPLTTYAEMWSGSADASGADTAGLCDQMEMEGQRKMLSDRFARTLRENACLLWSHINYEHPYPDRARKDALGKYVGRNKAQVNDWFTNWRARVWKREVRGDSRPTWRRLVVKVLALIRTVRWYRRICRRDRRRESPGVVVRDSLSRSQISC